MNEIEWYLNYGFEKMFNQILLMNDSGISLKKRMKLIECLFQKDELKAMPKEVALAYIHSKEKAEQLYYYYKNKLK